MTLFERMIARWNKSDMAGILEIVQALAGFAALMTYMIETYSATEQLCVIQQATELGLIHNITMNNCALQSEPSQWGTICRIDIGLSLFFMLDFSIHLVEKGTYSRFYIPRYMLTVASLTW
jgi:hypothetical protein